MRQESLINSFSLVAFFALAIFGLHQVINYADYTQGYFELACAVGILLNAFIFRYTRRTDIARAVLTSFVFALLLLLFTQGGIENTGIFWWFMFPLAVFFMTGRKEGLGWVIALYIASGILFFLGRLGILSISYDFLTVRQAWVVLLVITVLVYLYERAKERNELAIAMQEQRMRTLYAITTHTDWSIAEQFRAALKLGSETLSTRLAIISRIENRKFTVLYCVVPPDTIHEGDEFPLSKTYCDITVKKQEVLAIDHMLVSEYHAHPCYGKFKLESYIGLPIMVRGELYGTINFSSPSPHRPSFTESDRNFIRLMGKWVSATLEQQLTKEKEREIDQMKSEFVSLASHQLRTPLTGIKWFCDLLLRNMAGPLSKDQIDYVTQIATSNERLIKLVEDLLNVSHIETGKKFNLEKKPTDLIPIIDSINNDLVALAHQHTVTIVKAQNFPAQLLLNIDGGKIREVFGNLLSNAVKYSREDGVVELGFDESKPGQVIISVKDSGMGIPKDQQTRVFEKFFRADNAKTVQTQGTGLGLYIAKAITEKHDGKLWFESPTFVETSAGRQENKGTTFYVSLPYDSAPIEATFQYRTKR